MTRRTRILLVSAVVVLALTALGSQRGNRVAGTIGGREVIGISRHAWDAAEYSGNDAGATLTLGSRAATVTADSVALDDAQVLPIPASCRQVEIQDGGDGLRVTFR